MYKILIENKFDMLQLDLTFLKYISWAIPSIGFIGTVRGIGEALSKAAEAIDGNITGMTSSLGVAFNSTFVALLISIMLMLFITRIEYKQDSLIVSLRTKFLIKKKLETKVLKSFFLVFYRYYGLRFGRGSPYVCIY